MITSVEDVDAEIRRLKAIPQALSREDFIREYGFPMREITPTASTKTRFLQRC